MLSLDPATLAEYLVSDEADARAQAVLDAFTGTIYVRVYDGSNTLMGEGTLQAPWATRLGSTITVGELASFSVLVNGTPNAASWYLRFETAGGRWIRGPFGPGGLFTWSLGTWRTDQAGQIGTVTLNAQGLSGILGNAFVSSQATGNLYTSGTPYFTLAPTSATIPSGGGNIIFTAVDPNFGAITYSLTSRYRNDISIDSGSGAVSVPSAAAGTSGSITVRATDPSGAYAEASCAVTVQSQPVTGTLLFLDTFNYTANQMDSAAAKSAAFSAAGWSGYKDERSSPSGALGYLYTIPVTSIPGHSGSYPGASSRALCINSLAGTMSGQTDFYLQYGHTIGDIPANVWFQFWIYVCRSGAQMSQFHAREKFLYPTRNSYPATVGNNGGHWLLELAQSSYSPGWVDNTTPGAAYCLSRDGTIMSSVPYNSDPVAIANGITSSLGQTNYSAPMWTPNQWIETRIHYDTSGANGVFELWTRPLGGTRTKRAEWIGGTTPNFTWNIDPSFRDGHAMLRIPTTMPGPNMTGIYDCWMYMKDFAIATAESALPTY